MSLQLRKNEDFKAIEKQFIEQSGLSKDVFEKEVSFAIQILDTNKYLQKCSANSVLKSILNVAQTGLSLNPVKKQAYLVPRWNSLKQKTEAVLEPSYQGLVYLLEASGSINKMECYIVYEGDKFEFDMASDRKVVKHIPYYITGNEKGNVICVYSIATLKTNDKHVEIMPYHEIKEIRERSESYKAYRDKKVTSCIWVTDEGEMLRKTVIKRHFKYLPKNHKAFDAIEIDNNNNGYEVTFAFQSLLENKIESSIFSDEEKDRFLELLPTISKNDAQELLEIMNDNQKKSLDQQFDQKIK